MTKCGVYLSALVIVASVCGSVSPSPTSAQFEIPQNTSSTKTPSSSHTATFTPTNTRTQTRSQTSSLTATTSQSESNSASSSVSNTASKTYSRSAGAPSALPTPSVSHVVTPSWFPLVGFASLILILIVGGGVLVGLRHQHHGEAHQPYQHLQHPA
eukprot:c46623_g1_i1.p1 GENE.c46623_g1_i1~~c46623_g1_i1.p1  ORF type:complete len:170 (+),score=16.81 c46623_g1_i1:44-511(+)